jgi:CBS domain containing-hemolysin-like protein
MLDSSQAIHQTMLWPILAGLLVVLANAFFVTVEFAVVTVRRSQLGRLEEEGNANARLVLRLLRDPDWAIAASQVGITSTSILLGIVAEEPLQELLAPLLERTVARAPVLAGVSGIVGTLVVLLLLSFVHMVLGEQTPKTIALRFNCKAPFCIAPYVGVRRLTTPLVWLVDQSTAFVLRLLGIGGQTVGHGIHTVEELKDVVGEQARWRDSVWGREDAFPCNRVRRTVRAGGDDPAHRHRRC